jgi:hypothetical protein
MDGQGFESLCGEEITLFFKRSKPALGHTQPPVQWTIGFLSRWQSGRGAAVKSEWSYTSAPPTCLSGVGTGNIYLQRTFTAVIFCFLTTDVFEIINPLTL